VVFSKKHIPSKILCVVDIWSYKLRVCAAKFKNKGIEILSYKEKRQNVSYFANNECLNLPWLCENISEIIGKLEEDIGIKLDDIIINYPFWEMFLWSKSINYKRDSANKKIDITELEKIMESVEKLCLKKLTSQVDKFYGLSKDEVQIILSRVNNISMDSLPCEKIIWKKWSNIKISLLNAFIPSLKHNLISQIWTVLGKNIYRILPTEYCITKIFPQKNILIINLGATQTTLSLKHEWVVIWVSKIPIGINDLVTKITKTHPDTKAEIIDNLSSDRYGLEKWSFLDVWWESIGITLSELLDDKICPKYLYIWWGWANNNFIQDYLQNFNFLKHNIRILKDVEFINEDMTQIIKPIKNLKIEDMTRIPLDMYVLLLETNHIISRSHDVLSNSLKVAIKNLWYIKS